MNPEDFLKNKNLKAILFDMDGVLVDSMNYHLKSWKELLGSFNVNVSDQFIFEHEGAMSSEIIRELFKENGDPLTRNKSKNIFDPKSHLFIPLFTSGESLPGFIVFVGTIEKQRNLIRPGNQFQKKSD